MASWFNKKKAPDGTTIIRHDDIQRQIGSLGRTSVEFLQAREAAYERIFGKAVNVSHELVPQIPHIDIYVFRRSRGDQFVYSLVTGGMSDLEMNFPRTSEDVPRRV